MVLPIGTDVRLRGRPIGNYALIVANILVFVLTNMRGIEFIDVLLPPLNAAVPSLHEYLTYQFRHGDLMHLVGNMLFLYIFGNAVCDRMGSINYVVFYLASGIVAGVVYAQGSSQSLVGASGAIAAVTTAFLVLYPRVNITVLVFMVIITTIQLPAMLLIVLKIIVWDNIVAPRLANGMYSNIAFSAHLAGYTFGLLATLFLLGVRALPRNQFDLPAIWSRWGRRAGLNDVVSFPQYPTARPIAAEELESRPLERISSPAMQLREDICDRIYENDMNEAMRLYEQMMALDRTLVLPRDHQRTMANHLAKAQRQASAVHAYEGYLRLYPGAPDAPAIHLLLGIWYRREFHDFEQASKNLRIAVEGLHLDGQRRMAEDELQKAQAGIAT